MNSKERVLKAFRKKEGFPDRVPIQFDLCRQHTESFGKILGIKPDYSLSYYEDLTYRISANDIRTKMGSDVVVVEELYLLATHRKLFMRMFTRMNSGCI